MSARDGITHVVSRTWETLLDGRPLLANMRCGVDMLVTPRLASAWRHGAPTCLACAASARARNP